MSWQDFLFLFGNVVNGLALLPTIWHRYRLPAKTTVVTAFTLTLFTLAFLGNRAFIPAASMAFCAGLWWFLAYSSLQALFWKNCFGFHRWEETRLDPLTRRPWRSCDRCDIVQYRTNGKWGYE